MKNIKISIADICIGCHNLGLNNLHRFLTDRPKDYDIYYTKIKPGNSLLRTSSFELEFNRNAIGIYLNNKRYINSALLGLCTIISVLNDGLVLHSSGHIIGEEAILFCGKANSGKTTIVRKYNFPILGDDVIILRMIRDKVYAFPTPFGLCEVDNKPYPVKRCFFIKRAKRTKVEKLTISESIPQLFSNLLFVCHNKKIIEMLLKNILNISKRLTFFNLYFSLDNIPHGLTNV